jgi:hypothetical protein
VEFATTVENLVAFTPTTGNEYFVKKERKRIKENVD